MASAEEFGIFVPTTNVWDLSDIKDINVNSTEFKELLVRLYQNVNNIALALNVKDSAYYDTREFVTGGNFFVNPNATPEQNTVYRPVYRMVIDFGALPNAAGTKSVPHNITCTTSTSFTKIYGVATKPTVPFSYIPLPYASSNAADIIELNADGTNVNVTVASNKSAYSLVYIILEYMQT